MDKNIAPEKDIKNYTNSIKLYYSEANSNYKSLSDDELFLSIKKVWNTYDELYDITNLLRKEWQKVVEEAIHRGYTYKDCFDHT